MQEMTRSRFESEAARLRPMLLRLSAALVGEADADDIAQETLLKLWFLRDRLDSYSCIDAPARVIARNLSINVLRHRKASPIALAEVPDIVTEEYDTTFGDELLQALAALPDTEMAVLRMKHLEGMETEEIATLINSTPGAVRTALCRARRRIRELYNPSR